MAKTAWPAWSRHLTRPADRDDDRESDHLYAARYYARLVAALRRAGDDPAGDGGRERVAAPVPDPRRPVDHPVEHGVSSRRP